MTRKDYRLIARALRRLEGRASSERDHDLLRELVDELSDELKADNPSFDRDKFIDACLTEMDKETA